MKKLIKRLRAGSLIIIYEKRPNKTEISPFMQLIERAAKAVMIGHLYVTILDKHGKQIPATISKLVKTD